MGPRRRDLWLAAAVAPVAWAFDLELTYVLATDACGAGFGERLPLYVVPLAAVLVAAAGGLWCWRGWRAAAGIPAGTASVEAWPPDRFLAACGMAASAFFIFVILGQSIPIAVLPPCV